MTPAVVLAALAGLAAAGAIVGLAEAAREGSAERAARRASTPRRRRAVVALVLRVARPMGARAAGTRDLDGRLDAAGRPLGLTAADLLALESGAALAGLLLALATAPLAPGRLGVLILAAAPAAGFATPELLVRRRARARARRVELELAGVAELLRVAVEAGLPPVRALGEVGRRHSGLLAAELRAVEARTALGVPREEALDRLARRVPTPGVATLTAALRRSSQHGAPLAPALASLAADARAERARRVADAAARAGPKVQLVVAVVLVPAVLLFVAAALAASLT